MGQGGRGGLLSAGAGRSPSSWRTGYHVQHDPEFLLINMTMTETKILRQHVLRSSAGSYVIQHIPTELRVHLEGVDGPFPYIATPVWCRWCVVARFCLAKIDLRGCCWNDACSPIPIIHAICAGPLRHFCNLQDEDQPVKSKMRCIVQENSISTVRGSMLHLRSCTEL